MLRNVWENPSDTNPHGWLRELYGSLESLEAELEQLSLTFKVPLAPGRKLFEAWQATYCTEAFRTIHTVLFSTPDPHFENHLVLQSMGLLWVPPSIGLYTALHTLDLSQNFLRYLPHALGMLAHLRALDLSHNNLATLGPSFTQLLQLETLDLSFNGFSTLPPEIAHLPNLKTLFTNLQDDFTSSQPMIAGKLVIHGPRSSGVALEVLSDQMLPSVAPPLEDDALSSEWTVPAFPHPPSPLNVLIQVGVIAIPPEAKETQSFSVLQPLVDDQLVEKSLLDKCYPHLLPQERSYWLESIVEMPTTLVTLSGHPGRAWSLLSAPPDGHCGYWALNTNRALVRNYIQENLGLYRRFLVQCFFETYMEGNDYPFPPLNTEDLRISFCCADTNPWGSGRDEIARLRSLFDNDEWLQVYLNTEIGALGNPRPNGRFLDITASFGEAHKHCLMQLVAESIRCAVEVYTLTHAATREVRLTYHHHPQALPGEAPLPLITLLLTTNPKHYWRMVELFS